MSRLLFLTLKFYLILLIIIFSNTVTNLYPNEIIEVREEDGFTYALSLPVHYQKEKKYVLGICLHGLGGSGKFMLKDFAIYSRYMNMIIACPNGNIPDPSRNATKWGGEDSLEYINNFYRLILSKYNIYENPFLLGFSQGANQALFLSLKNPELFKTVIILSGGYSDIPKEYYPNAEKLNLLFISGDTGPGEIYTLRKMNERLEVLKPYSKIPQIICNGFIHETSPAYAYKIFQWYIQKNPRYKKNFWLNQGDFYKLFVDAESEFQKSNFSESMELYKKSLVINPVYPPAVLRFAHASLLSGKMKSFRKSFFSGLQLYSTDPYFSGKFVSEIIEDIRITFKPDKKLREHFLTKLQNGFIDMEVYLTPILRAELSLLLGHLNSYSGKKEESEIYYKKSLDLYAEFDESSTVYKDYNVDTKRFFLENR